MKIKFSAILFSIWFGLLFCFGNLARADITSGLQLWLTLNQTNGLTVNDASGNGNTGTLMNTPTTNDLVWVPAILTNGLSLNAPTNVTPFTNEFVYVQDAPGLNFTTNLTYTIAAWVNCNSGVAGTVNTEPSGAGVIDKGPGRVQQYTFDFNAGLLRFYSDNAAGVTTPISSTFKLTNGVWYHIVGVYNGVSTPKAMTLYINGVLNASEATASVPTSLIATTNGVNIGARQSAAGTAYNQSFKGFLDDIRVYNRALSSSDVLQLYQYGLIAPTVLTQPKSLTRFTNDPAFFAVAANSSGTPAFQWQLNGTNIPSATSAVLTLNNVQFTNAGAYTAVISNSFGSVTSAPAMLTVSALPAPDTNDNLVAYWKFDEGTGIVANDSSTNGNTGQLLALMADPPLWTNGIINGSLFFNLDPTNSPNVMCAPNFNTSDNGMFDFSSNGMFTLACWVKTAKPTASAVGIISKGFGGGGEEYAMDVQTQVGGIVFYRFFMRDSVGTAWSLLAPVPPNGLWQHLACVYNTTNSIMYYYVNGQLAAWTNAVAPAMLSSTHELSVGNRQSAQAAYNDPWIGNIDEVHIYSRDLNAADIQAIYTAAAVPPSVQTQPISMTRHPNDSGLFTVGIGATTVAPFTYQWQFNGANLAGATNSYLALTGIQGSNGGNYTVAITNSFGSATSSVATLTVTSFPTNALSDNLLAYWKFDETSGLAANDSSPNANNAQLSGFFNDPAEWVPGIINGALQFDADASGADMVACPGPGSPDNGVFDFSTGLAFTLECWVKSVATQTNGAGIIAKGNGGGGEQFALDVQGAVYRFYIRDQNTNAYAVVSAIPPDGSWQHLAAIYNATNGIQSLYINGQLAGSIPNSFNGVPTSPVLPPTSLASNQHEVSIGNRQSSAAATYNLFWNGLIDDVRIYNRDLNAREIQTLFDTVATVTPVSLSGLTSIAAGGGGSGVASFQMTGAGPANLDYRIWGTTNVATPFAQWTLVTNGVFNASGQFTFTDLSATNIPSRFYRVSVP